MTHEVSTSHLHSHFTPPLTPRFKQLQQLVPPVILLHHKAQRSPGAVEYKHVQIASAFPTPPMPAALHQRENQCCFIYSLYKTKFKGIIPFCLCIGEPVKGRPCVVVSWDCGLHKTNTCALDFLPRFTRGCSLEKYVGSCEQIRFMDFDCWKTTAGQKTSCLAGANVWLALGVDLSPAQCVYR